MRSYFDKSPIAAGFTATVAVVGVGWLACAGPAPVDKTTDDDVLTAEQCIDNHAIKGSVEPFEDSLVAEGIVDGDLDKISITQEMCEEIIERTPGGSPIERAVAVGNLTQELDVIKESMEDAADKDVNGDGTLDAEDTKVAAAASYAAAHAAQETVRRAAEEGSTDGGAIEELNAVPAAHLARRQTTASPSSIASDSQYASDDASASDSQYASDDASASGSASAAASAAAGEAPPAGEDQPAEPSTREEAQINASSAAREKDAGQEAAAGGSQCAATVALMDGTVLDVKGGYVAFKAPAKELRWKDNDRAQLLAQSELVGSIEQLEQEAARAEGAGESEAECLKLGHLMKPQMFSPDDGLDIKGFDRPPEKELLADESTQWRWNIRASERGYHPLFLIVVQTVRTSEGPEGQSHRSFEATPFEGSINVSASRWQVFADFIAQRWPVLVPLLLTILTAIIIPFVVPWWKRRNQPSEPVDRSSAYRDDGWM